MIWKVSMIVMMNKIISIFAKDKNLIIMQKITSQPRTFVILTMIFMAAFARLIPPPWNFTPIAAMALFGGVYYKDKTMAFIITILSLMVLRLKKGMLLGKMILINILAMALQRLLLP